MKMIKINLDLVVILNYLYLCSQVSNKQPKNNVNQGTLVTLPFLSDFENTNKFYSKV